MHQYCLEHDNDGASFTCGKTGVQFVFRNSSGGGKLTFVTGVTGGLPATDAVTQQFKNRGSYHKTQLFGLLQPDNINQTSFQKELLKWRFCLGHWNMGYKL